MANFESDYSRPERTQTFFLPEEVPMSRTRHQLDLKSPYVNNAFRMQEVMANRYFRIRQVIEEEHEFYNPENRGMMGVLFSQNRVVVTGNWLAYNAYDAEKTGFEGLMTLPLPKDEYGYFSADPKIIYAVRPDGVVIINGAVDRVAQQVYEKFGSVFSTDYPYNDRKPYNVPFFDAKLKVQETPSGLLYPQLIFTEIEAFTHQDLNKDLVVDRNS